MLDLDYVVMQVSVAKHLNFEGDGLQQTTGPSTPATHALFGQRQQETQA
ncbi:hypothetical protein [Halomonas sp. H2]